MPVREARRFVQENRASWQLGDAIPIRAPGAPGFSAPGTEQRANPMLLVKGLIMPFAWVITVTRSRLGTVGGLVGVVALTLPLAEAVAPLATDAVMHAWRRLTKV
jgi:hypothetical protein